MAYSLATSYTGEALLSGFDWFSGEDPSHGYVSYQDREAAEGLGLFSVDPDTNVVRLGVESTQVYGPDEGRPSIRLESKEAYNHGLFIADFQHMPPSQCGLWPAFWAYGAEWPAGGELDLIEGANMAHSNIISAHTADGCVQSASELFAFSGEMRNTECAIGDFNVGCGFDPPTSDAATYGDGFNAAGGGVYAMQWDEERIRVWHFARADVPADIADKAPAPEGWGLPHAVFGGDGCDVDSYWKDMSLVININFCGDYGNAIWGQGDDTCTDFAPTCAEYVAQNPQAFANAYWDINYIDAYQFDSEARPTTVEPTPTSTSTTTMTTYSTTFVTVGGTVLASVVPIDHSMASNSTATAAPVNPIAIGEHTYLGCFGSESGFSTFELVEEADDMTLDLCVELCHDVTYAGVQAGKCFCAPQLDADTRALNDQALCNDPCPGTASQLCGGAAPPEPALDGSSSPFPAASAGLLSVYAAVLDDEVPEPPAMATGLSGPARTITTTWCPTGTGAPVGRPTGANDITDPAIVSAARARARVGSWSGVNWNVLVSVTAMTIVVLLM